MPGPFAVQRRSSCANGQCAVPSTPAASEACVSGSCAVPSPTSSIERAVQSSGSATETSALLSRSIHVPAGQNPEFRYERVRPDGSRWAWGNLGAFSADTTRVSLEGVGDIAVRRNADGSSTFTISTRPGSATITPFVNGTPLTESSTVSQTPPTPPTPLNRPIAPLPEVSLDHPRARPQPFISNPTAATPNASNTPAPSPTPSVAPLPEVVLPPRPTPTTPPQQLNPNPAIPTNSPTPTPSPTAPPTPAPTATPTPTPAPAPAPAPAPVAAPTPAPTPTPAPSPAPTTTPAPSTAPPQQSSPATPTPVAPSPAPSSTPPVVTLPPLAPTAQLSVHERGIQLLRAAGAVPANSPADGVLRVRIGQETNDFRYNAARTSWEWAGVPQANAQHNWQGLTATYQETNPDRISFNQLARSLRALSPDSSSRPH